MKEKLLIFFTEILPGILFKLMCVVILVFCVHVTGGIGGTICVGLGFITVIIVITGAIIGKKKKYRLRMRQVRFAWLVVLGAVFISMNLFYDMGTLKSSLPMRYFFDQHIYQEADRQSGSMADAYLRELIRYRTVALPYGVRNYIEYNPIADEDERGSGFVKDYYIENNYTRYFMEYSLDAYTDETLPGVKEVRSEMFDPEFFEDMGIANDMLRYTFLLNHEHSKETKYFWYSWYYYSFAESKERYAHIHVNRESCNEPSLVALWDSRENLYLMGRSYYETRIAGRKEVSQNRPAAGRARH